MTVAIFHSEGILLNIRHKFMICVNNGKVVSAVILINQIGIPSSPVALLSEMAISNFNTVSSSVSIKSRVGICGLVRSSSRADVPMFHENFSPISVKKSLSVFTISRGPVCPLNEFILSLLLVFLSSLLRAKHNVVGITEVSKILSHQLIF